MARQAYNVNTSQKQLEVFSSFGGGMVTQVHPEKLKDDQSVLIENGDIVAGGAVENRGAYSQTNKGTVLGKTQGRFHYEDIVTGGQDLVAINGQLYKVVGTVYTNLPITNLANFQNTRLIDAAQVRDKLYIATGSGLVMYDGTTASLVPAYVPNGLEYLYIGSNGYASNPDTAITDTVGTADVILAVIPSSRYGLINQAITFTAYISKPTADTLEYQFETAPVSTGTYTIDQAFSATKTFTKTFNAAVDYTIRVSIRKVSTTLVLNQYVLPSYKVNSVPDTKPEEAITFTNISTCNRIFLHYDRLFLYGDTTNPSFLYPSHLNKFDYYPRTNIIKITDPLRGAINNIAPYRDFLVCFTDGSLQMITGTNPQEFELLPINKSLGCKLAYTVQVLKNFIMFVANNNGVYILKTVRATGLMMDVERIDLNNQDAIIAELKVATNVLTTVYNNQYYLYIETPTTTNVYRFYYELNIWVKDTLPIKFATLSTWNNTLVSASFNDGTFYKLTKDSVLDDVKTQFTMRIISKDYHFGLPHHRKKLKQYQLIAKIGFITTMIVSIYADDNELTTMPLIYDYTQDSDTQKLKVMTSGRFRTVKTDLSVLVKEKLQLIGFGFIFKENTPK